MKTLRLKKHLLKKSKNLQCLKEEQTLMNSKYLNLKSTLVEELFKKEENL